MEKQKRWQFYLILTVIFLTLYNIFPTVFYYAKPLRKPINAKEAAQVEKDIVERVNNLEDFTLSWLKAESKNLKVKPLDIYIEKTNPRLAKVVFEKKEDAEFFAKTLFRAGSLIPFVPAELTPVDLDSSGKNYVVTLQRKVGVHLDPAKKDDYFSYIPKRIDGSLSPEYRSIIDERAAKLAEGFGGESQPAKILLDMVNGNENEEDLVRLSRSIVDYENTFGEKNPLTKRYFASFTQTASKKAGKEELISTFLLNLNNYSGKLSKQIESINSEKESLQKDGQFLSSDQQQTLAILDSQKNIVDAAKSIVSRNSSLFTDSQSPLDFEEISSAFKGNNVVVLGKRNPFIKEITINWDKESIELVLHDDVSQLLQTDARSEEIAFKKEKLSSLLFNAMGASARVSDEKIQEGVANFSISLNELTNSTSILVFDLKAVAKQEMATLQDFLKQQWKPTSELGEESYPHFSSNSQAFENEKLGMFFYSPILDEKQNSGFHEDSLYVILRGFETILRKYESLPDSDSKKAFENDFSTLAKLLHQTGMSGYAGKNSYLPAAYAGDYIFELPNAYTYLIAATRENFSQKGNKKVAILEFTDVEQRILTTNKIETATHEDLVKWRDEYQSVQVSAIPEAKYDVPKPTQSALLSNLVLSAKKYFRGDERKILKWGLDLSGGKTVRIGLRDQSGQAITDEDDIKGAINELYERVNKLGVSEVAIRQEGNSIVLDFPGSQGLSASELVKASAMYFHVVNEKFSPANPLLKEAINTFLEEVWNEAVITNRKNSEGVNEIAWQHLGGSYEHEDEFFPASSHAKLLYDNGLRLTGPKGPKRSSVFDDTLSQIGVLRGENFTEWQGQTHPLLVVFRNFALEGSNLTNVQTAYDPSEGNLLNFAVKSSDIENGRKVNPRDDFYAWTSQFSEEKIQGTPKEAYSQGRGWRMAVILNGTIVSAPTLNSALRDSARITGHFSQREVNALASDLKAGSLSFTPYILSEENVSPDLGKEQRVQGIVAALVGVLLVIILMIACYRFGGFIACIAVIFNLFILWAVLQNLSAALTLPGIAGIILGIGMAVDANVLVFERIREEFKKHGKLASSIQVGYRKAFTAIFDSNITTIIAALILLNFDSGPIKGFALTLIIGIVSSMFSALFMTRFFFSWWVQNPKHKSLSMAKIFEGANFNFLKYAKPVIIGSLLIMIAGLFCFYAQKSTIFGMDFKGGYALTLDLQEQPNVNYRLQAEKALLDQGLKSSDFSIRELNRPNQLRMQLGITLEEEGKPFYKIDEKAPIDTPLYRYQEYPRIVWIVDALEKEGLKLNPATLSTLNLHWNEMSGQLSDTMRTQALLGIGLAMIAILIYITFRFEFNYAISATLGLVHDILITIALLALLHIFFYNIQIDLQVIAALVTIVGYSLNDTIIIFDRIREDIKIYRKMNFKEVVNQALNSTLNRTIMTSGTTLVVLLSLVILGGPAVFNFSLILTLGVLVGTLSSLFVAAPLLIYFHQRSLKKLGGEASRNL